MQLTETTRATPTGEDAGAATAVAQPVPAGPFAAVSAAILVTWSLHNALLLPWERARVDPAIMDPLLVLVRAVVWMVPVALYLRRYDPRPAPIALGVGTPIHRRGLLLGSLPALVYLGLVCMLQQPADPTRLSLQSLIATLGQAPTLYMFLTIVLEELLMRGFLLDQCARRMRVARAQLLVAVLFAAMHVPGWIALIGPRVELVPMGLSVFLLGLVLGVSARASGSIVPAIVLHFANNLLAEWLTRG